MKENKNYSDFSYNCNEVRQPLIIFQLNVLTEQPIIV